MQYVAHDRKKCELLDRFILSTRFTDVLYKLGILFTFTFIYDVINTRLKIFPVQFVHVYIFLYVIVSQIGPGLIELLKYKFTRTKKDETALEDVYDGLLYRNLSKPGGFLSDPNNISLLGNTDGVALIKSTGWSVWPVYLVINKLPPLLRYLIYDWSVYN